MQGVEKIRLMVETGSKRTFASALDWPGWSRNGKEEDQAIHALFDYAPRYEKSIKSSGIPFQPPTSLADFKVVERVPGNVTTDFGAPNVAIASDSGKVSEDELMRMQSILAACWRYFDEVVSNSCGRELQKGPRGGGREVDQIAQHVHEAENAYLRSLGAKPGMSPSDDQFQDLSDSRREVLSALAKAARGELPMVGPRGKAYWKPRTFVRRAAWHILDHAWEIEDRIK